MDSDQYLDVEPSEQPYVLTSMIKKFDVAVYELVHMLVDGELRPGVRILGLAEKAVGYSTTGGHLSIDTIAALERYRQEIVAGTRSCRARPTGALEPPRGVVPTTTLTVTFDGSTCRYDGPAPSSTPGMVRVEFVNTSDSTDGWTFYPAGEFAVQVPALGGHAELRVRRARGCRGLCVRLPFGVGKEDRRTNGEGRPWLRQHGSVC